MTNDTEVLIKKLRNYNVKIIGLLDAWKGLFRFWKLNEKLKLMPDVLLVFDRKIKNFLSKKGININVKIVKNPIF